MTILWTLSRNTSPKLCITCQAKILVKLGCQEPKFLVEKNIYREKQWVLRYVGLQHVLHLGNVFLQICLLFSPGLIQSQYTGVLWRRRACVQWSMWTLVQYCGMIYSALCPWPWFAGARETWGLADQLESFPPILNLRLGFIVFSDWIMKLLMRGSCLWSCL